MIKQKPPMGETGVVKRRNYYYDGSSAVVINLFYY